MSMATGASLYLCDVMHARLRPHARRFQYRVFSILIDIDAPETPGCRLFSVNKRNVLSFHERDHGARDGSRLRPWVEESLRRASIAETPARIALLCFPRLWGFVFNPLSVFYCYDVQGEIFAVVHEVNNTFGDSHVYAARVPRAGSDVAAHEAQKVFHVSPLMAMEGRYAFRLRPPGERLSIGIQLHDAKGLLLAAAQTGRRRDLTTGEALRAVLRHPLMTLKVVAAIHFEALRTFLSGARYYPRPTPPEFPVSGALPLRAPDATIDPVKLAAE